MPAINVTKSIQINAPLAEVKKHISDYRNWPAWSPWLILEPEAKLDFAEDGKFYHWEGKRVGEGEMKITSENDNKISNDLTFLKPWKSKAKTHFDFNEKDNGVEVTWVMESSLPFFMFFMKKSMETYIGMDYERGLKMLKEMVETGKVSSKLEVLPQENVQETQFVGIKRDSKFSKIQEVMSVDFAKLYEVVNEGTIKPNGAPFVQYHKIDFPKDYLHYTAAFPVSSIPDNLPEGVISGKLPAMKLQKIKHTGKYDYLGNPWSLGMMMIRNKEFKQDKKIAPFEIYVNDPQQTKPEELISEVAYAVK